MSCSGSGAKRKVDSAVAVVNNIKHIGWREKNSLKNRKFRLLFAAAVTAVVAGSSAV